MLRNETGAQHLHPLPRDFLHNGRVIQEPPASEWHQVVKFPRADPLCQRRPPPAAARDSLAVAPQSLATSAGQILGRTVGPLLPGFCWQCCRLDRKTCPSAKPPYTTAACARSNRRETGGPLRSIFPMLSRQRHIPGSPTAASVAASPKESGPVAVRRETARDLVRRSAIPAVRRGPMDRWSSPRCSLPRFPTLCECAHRAVAPRKKSALLPGRSRPSANRKHSAPQQFLAWTRKSASSRRTALSR